MKLRFFWTAGNLVDPVSDEPLWTNNELVRDYFNLYKRAYSIVGNPYIPEHWEENGWVHLFETEQRLAMVAQFFGPPNEAANVNWDVATYPEPEKGVPSRGWAMGVSSTSEHHEEVMRVLNFWFTDEQLLNNSFTRGPLYVPFPHLYEDGVAQEVALETEGHIWEGRNMEAIFSLPVADAPESMSKYENDGVVSEALNQFVNGDEIDLNTLLREKYEQELVRIEEEKAVE